MLRGALIGLLLALALPASAAAVPQTFVSGVGDDTNTSLNCSRTAPCKTFAGAISVTSAGGEITALDDGGFGAITITKAITINGNGLNASILVSGTDGIVVVAGASDRVVLKDLNIVGDNNTGLNAITITSARSVDVQDSEIRYFADSGIDDESTDGTRVDVSGTSIDDNNGNGVVLAPGSGSPGFVSLENDTIDGNACGLVATAFGMPSSPLFGTNCGVNTSGTSSGAATVSAANSAIMDNTGAGAFANGSPSTDYIQKDTLTNNGTGLQELAGGQIVWVGENWVYGNSANGAPTSTVSGPPGAQGPAGSRGASGKVELVTCKTVTKKIKKHGKTKKKKVQKCSATLVSGTLKIKITSRVVHATLTRGGTVYATGRMSLGGRSQAVLSPRRRLRAGRYVLTLRSNGHVLGRRTVVVH